MALCGAFATVFLAISALGQLSLDQNAKKSENMLVRDLLIIHSHYVINGYMLSIYIVSDRPKDLNTKKMCSDILLLFCYLHTCNRAFLRQ